MSKEIIEYNSNLIINETTKNLYDTNRAAYGANQEQYGEWYRAGINLKQAIQALTGDFPCFVGDKNEKGVYFSPKKLGNLHGKTFFPVMLLNRLHSGYGQFLSGLNKDTITLETKVIAPATTDQGTTDQGTTDQGTTDQGTTDQGTTDQGTTDQGTTDTVETITEEFETILDIIANLAKDVITKKKATKADLLLALRLINDHASGTYEE